MMKRANRVLTHFWVRDEYKLHERRCPVTPETASVLLKSGFSITIESSKDRVFRDEEFTSIGCKIAKSQSWPTAPKDTIILGLKELPLHGQVQGVPDSLTHRHILFGHSYKYQSGWEVSLSRFQSGGGELLDLEYLKWDNGTRVAAFGKEAGFAGAALGVMNWCHQKIHGFEVPFPKIRSYNYKKELIDDIKVMLKKLGVTPSSLVIGSHGRCGTGAMECLHLLGIDNVEQWNSGDTKAGGPFLHIAQVDLAVHSIYLSEKQPKNIFLDVETLERSNRDGSRKLTVLADVSCDVTNPKNPFPMSNRSTTFDEPIYRVKTSKQPLDIIAIDHLPSLVPREASIEFSKLLLPHLITLKNYSFEKNCTSTEQERVWERARSLFKEKLLEKDFK